MWTPDKLNSKRAAKKNQGLHQQSPQTVAPIIKKYGPPEPFPSEIQKFQLRMHHEQIQRQQQPFLLHRQPQMQPHQHLYFNNGFLPQRPPLLPNQHPMPGSDRFSPMSVPHHNNLSNPMLNCYAGSDASLDSIPGSSVSGPARVSHTCSSSMCFRGVFPRTK